MDSAGATPPSAVGGGSSAPTSGGGLGSTGAGSAPAPEGFHHHPGRRLVQ